MTAFPKFDVDAAIQGLHHSRPAQETTSSRNSKSSNNQTQESDFCHQANSEIRANRANPNPIKGLPAADTEHVEKIENREDSAATVATSATPVNAGAIAKARGLTLADMRQTAGLDWKEIKDDQGTLEALARSIQIRRMRERGETPPHYTATTVCDRCGQVPIFPGAGKRVKGCPWCFNRISGLPVPRATRDC